MRQALLAVLVVAPVVAAGCVTGQNCEINPGSYKCQAGGSGNLDRTDTWDNSASRAEVKVQMGGSGDLAITIQDAAGTQVFDESYTGSGGQSVTKTTSAGEPGEWTVHIQGDFNGGVQITITSQ